MTGKTGTPQPITLHGAVEKPSTLVRAPATLACPAALLPIARSLSWSRR